MDIPLRFLLFLEQEICFEIFISHTHTHTHTHTTLELNYLHSNPHITKTYIYTYINTHTNCVIFAKLCNLPVPQFIYLKNKDSNIPYLICCYEV